MAQKRYTNQELAEIFQTIANLLEIKGEVIYKILAYRKAADSLLDYGGNVYDVWQDGKLTDIPGVGKAIAEKILEQTKISNIAEILNLNGTEDWTVLLRTSQNIKSGKD